MTTTATYSFVAGATSTVALTPAAGSAYDVEPGPAASVSAQLTDASGNPDALGNQAIVFSFANNSAGAILPTGLSTVSYTA